MADIEDLTVATGIEDADEFHFVRPAESDPKDRSVSASLVRQYVGGASINTQTGTTYQLVLTDASKVVTLDNGAAIALTVPPNSTVAFPVGTQIELIQLGAGQVTVTAGGGVTLGTAGPGLLISAQYGVVALIKVATDTWVVNGSLSA